MTNGDFDDLRRRLRRDTNALTTDLGRVLDHPITKGKFVALVMAAGQTSVTAFHGLGRAYIGGFIAGASAALPLVVALPSSGATISVTVLSATAPVADTSILAWVF